MNKHYLRTRIAYLLIIALMLTSLLQPMQAEAAKQLKSPSGIIITKLESGLRVEWTRIKSADGYQLERQSAGNDTWEQVSKGKKAKITDSDAIETGKVSYRVRAYVKEGGNTVWSAYSKVFTWEEAGVFSTEGIPGYSGEKYIEINGNEPFFTASERKNAKAFENYSELDSLGRCGVAFANVCKEIMPTEERGAIGSVKPSGWHTVKYNGLVDGNYLYNRCHLIAFMLAGENANPKNLITGTRAFNVEGMLPFEDMVGDYVKAKGNHVLYRVTPIFTGDNLVADGVLMEAYSVEDKGQGICFCVFVYNVQQGIEIDYKTGESCIAGSASTSGTGGSSVASGDSAGAGGGNTSGSGNTNGAGNDLPETSDVLYVLNRSTKKVHYESCSSVKKISEEHKEVTNLAIEELKKLGYSPCGNCKPVTVHKSR